MQARNRPSPYPPSDHPYPTAKRARRRIYPILLPFPIVCFIGALLTDIAYWRTAEMMWSNFSAWLLTFGVALGVLAAIAGFIDFLGNRMIHGQRVAWMHIVGNGIAWILSVINAFVHTHDAWTSVVPTGLTLSAVVVLILLITGWAGRSPAYRQSVGVTE